MSIVIHHHVIQSLGMECVRVLLPHLQVDVSNTHEQLDLNLYLSLSLQIPQSPQLLAVYLPESPGLGLGLLHLDEHNFCYLFRLDCPQTVHIIILLAKLGS